MILFLFWWYVAICIITTYYTFSFIKTKIEHPLLMYIVAFIACMIFTPIMVILVDIDIVLREK